MNENTGKPKSKKVPITLNILVYEALKTLADKQCRSVSDTAARLIESCLEKQGE